MLNIISQSLAAKKVRGPKKVATNLIRGLDQLGYPYVINKQLDACPLLWIHDDTYALEKIASLPAAIKVIVGPNLFINPENIPAGLDLSRAVYIQPSPLVAQVWHARGYNKSDLDVWPVGIDTEKYTPAPDSKKDSVLVYFKNRTQAELTSVTAQLTNKKIPFTTIAYGNYTESEYLTALARARYIIWLGGYESQGIAFEEALSCDVPALVIDKEMPGTSFDTNSTSAPYFSPECGIKIKGFTDFPSALDRMEMGCEKFHPRNFIVQNLSLRGQALNFLKLYEKHFGLTVEDGMPQTPAPSVSVSNISEPIADWKGRSWLQKVLNKIRQKLLRS